MVNYLIFGDRGTRAAFLAQQLPHEGDRVWFVAQERFSGPLPAGVEWHWVNVNAGGRGAGGRVADAFTAPSLDVCLFDEPSDTENPPAVLSALYLTTAILCLQKLMPALRRTSSARVLFIGAPPSSPESAQLGIRTVAQALREMTRASRTSITCLFTAAILTHEASPHAAVRRADLLALVRCLLALSPHSAVQELYLDAL